MKKLFAVIALFAGMSMGLSAQATTQNATMKDHVCTAACMNGNHMYVHGEKGHVCTDACKKTKKAETKMKLKDHVCTADCKNGNHMYLHGEKGHVCTESCKKM